MELAVGAKSTKPGSKATAKKADLVNGRPPRVPVGVLHLIDTGSQALGASMYDAVCGEGGLMVVGGSWDDRFVNERCEPCSDQNWFQSFSTMQSTLASND